MPKSVVRIIGIDPGGTTGVCTFAKGVGKAAGWEYENMFHFFQLDRKEHHVALWRLLSEFDPNVVVCERFNSRPAVGGNGTVNLDAREYIGVAHLYADMTKKPFVLQTPAAAKGLWTDAKIKTLNLWQPNQKHAMDALRHVLYYMTSNKDLTAVLATRPRPGATSRLP